MSHKTSVETAFRDIEQVKAVCAEIGAEFLNTKSVNLYEGATPCAYAVKLPNWKYPVAVSEEGKATFDNYEGAWGKMAEFDKFRHEYATRVTLAESERIGYRVVHRERLSDGSLQIRLGR